MTDYAALASDELIQKAATALQKHGFLVQIVEDLTAAKDVVADIIPKGSSVFTGTSKTLEKAGILQMLEAGDYDALRPKMLEALKNDPTDAKSRKAITSAPDYMLASAAAITEDGYIMVASATGSQLAPEVYGASKVIYVVSTKKLVKNIDDGITRIQQYIYPQETIRLQEFYNTKDIVSHFNKLLIYREDSEERVTVILVKEPAGF